MKQTCFLRLASALAFSVAVASAPAAVITTVLDDTFGGTAPIGIQSSGLATGRLVAKVFQTPASDEWTLYQVRLALHTAVGGSPTQNVILRLYAVDPSSDKPTGSSLADTTATVSLTGGTTPAYYYPIALTGNGWKLAAVTKYAFVVAATNTSTAPLYWDRMSSSSYSTFEGFSYLETMTSVNDGGAWSTNNTLGNGITIEVVPEPTAIAYSLVLLGGVGGYVAFRRRARA